MIVGDVGNFILKINKTKELNISNIMFLIKSPNISNAPT